MLNALLFTCLVAWPSDDPAAALRGVQERYDAGGNLSAEFEQVYVDKLRGARKPETGVLWATEDGRVRWSYRKPVRKDFVYDGEKAYFYEPENAQVTVFENFQDTPLWSAMQFLWGQGKLTRVFAVSFCEQDCGEPSAAQAVLQLVPKDPIPNVSRALLLVDKKKRLVRTSIVFDALGNRTEYHFANLSFGKAIADAKFEFEIPDGVSVLRASPQ